MLYSYDNDNVVACTYERVVAQGYKRVSVSVIVVGLITIRRKKIFDLLFFSLVWKRCAALSSATLIQFNGALALLSVSSAYSAVYGLQREAKKYIKFSKEHNP